MGYNKLAFLRSSQYGISEDTKFIFFLMGISQHNFKRIAEKEVGGRKLGNPLWKSGKVYVHLQSTITERFLEKYVCEITQLSILSCGKSCLWKLKLALIRLWKKSIVEIELRKLKLAEIWLWENPSLWKVYYGSKVVKSFF